MWQAAVGPALSAAGGLVSGLFGDDSVSPILNVPELQGLVTGQKKNLTEDEALARENIGAFSEAEKRRAALARQLQGQELNNWQSLFDRFSGASHDPSNVYNQFLDRQLGEFYKFADYLPGGASRQDKITAAQLAQQGTRGSAALDSRRQNQFMSQLSPLFGNILAGAPAGASSLVQGRLGNLGALGGIIGSRTNALGIGRGLELGPSKEALGIRQGLLGNLGSAIEVGKSNIAGWQQNQNWADKVGGGLQAAGGAMSMFGGMGGGGAAGGALPNIGGLSNWGDMGLRGQGKYLGGMASAASQFPSFDAYYDWTKGRGQSEWE
jgi:hypothetical protein